MCFQIPKKIQKIQNNYAFVEGGEKVYLGSFHVKRGDYILVYGNTCVDKISKKKALQIRKTISIINASYEK